MTGLGLQWLVDQLEQCPAKEKLLLAWDCCQEGEGARLAPRAVVDRDDPRAEGAARPLARLRMPRGGGKLQGRPARPALCRTKGHSLFAASVADGYSGRADANRDGCVETTELFRISSGRHGRGGKRSEGCPDARTRPPRRPTAPLSHDAKKSIRKLAALLRNVKIDMDAAREQYVATRHAAGKELEPRLLWSLLLTKGKESDAATKRFEALKGEKPDLLLPMQGLAWLRFQKRTYTAGMNDLVELIDKIPNRQSPAVLIPPGCGDLQVGRPVAAVRRHSRTRGLSPGTELLAELDAAVAKHGSEGQRLYQEGRDHSASVLADFDQQLASGTDPAGLQAQGGAASAGPLRRLPLRAVFQ